MSMVKFGQSPCIYNLYPTQYSLPIQMVHRVYFQSLRATSEIMAHNPS